MEDEKPPVMTFLLESQGVAIFGALFYNDDFK